MFKDKGKAVPTSNDWWPPHSSEGDFTNHPTEANRVRDHLTLAEAAKYYPNGLPKDFKESAENAPVEAQEEAYKLKSAEVMVTKLTSVKDLDSSRNLTRNKIKELDSHMEAVAEDLPATPMPQRVLPMPVPTRRWSVIPPSETREAPSDTTTPMPKKSPVVHKPALAGAKKGSPLRRSWGLADCGDSSEENG